MKIIKFLKNIRYKISCLEDKLYGLDDDFKIVSKKEWLSYFLKDDLILHPFIKTSHYPGIFQPNQLRYRDSSNQLIAYEILDYGKRYCFIRKTNRYVSLEQFKIEEELTKNWHKRYPIFGYFIDLYNYFVYRLLSNIDMSWRKVYWFIQRGKRGYADIDVWNLYNYLARVISEGTKQLRKEKHGYPTELTPKKWSKILKQISEGFELIQNDSFGLTSIKNYKKNEKYYKKMRRKNKKYYPTKTEVKKIEKAFNLFKKHFASLWD